jgi:lipoprotein-anchoring transpeptidase ErfK/SrfK
VISFKLSRFFLLGFLVLELLALVSLGSLRLERLVTGGDDASATLALGISVSRAVPDAVTALAVSDVDLQPLLRLLEERAEQPTPEPEPPTPTLEELGALELATATPPAGVAFDEDERWIAVNLTTQRATAFVGAQPVRVALVTTGMPDWETPTGDFRVYQRVENETMDSEGLGIPIDSPDGWFVDNVLYTQYIFSGITLHYNYWRPQSYFGNIPSSHGCVGLGYSDAKFFWDFADIGTRVVVYKEEAEEVGEVEEVEEQPGQS